MLGISRRLAVLVPQTWTPLVRASTKHPPKNPPHSIKGPSDNIPTKFQEFFAHQKDMMEGNDVSLERFTIKSAKKLNERALVTEIADRFNQVSPQGLAEVSLQECAKKILGNHAKKFDYYFDDEDQRKGDVTAFVVQERPGIVDLYQITGGENPNGRED